MAATKPGRFVLVSDGGRRGRSRVTRGLRLPRDRAIAREADELQRGLRFLREGRIDALVAGGFLPSVRNGAELHDLEEKIVLAEYYRPTRLPVVQLDPAPGVAAGVRHLAELGHREILWTSWRSRGQEVAPERREAFEQEAQARGLKARVVTFEQQDDAAATRAGFIEFSQRRWAEYLRREPLPTAVFAYNELNGLGLYAALAERGLRVPRDVSVIGWDRLHDDLAVPAMTTVSLMLGEIGARAAELAIELAEGTRTVAELRGARERVPAELAVSASTAPPRA
ncbi:MAG: substrate-binding domain-containing protein [Planctomycetota bacterium]|nr:substrate-binding domain-containing protein [Planctomycetota bacterium]